MVSTEGIGAYDPDHEFPALTNVYLHDSNVNL